MIAKDNGRRIYPSHDFKNSKVNRDLLSKWIAKEQYPLVSKLGPSNHASILQQSNQVVVLHIVNSKDTASQSKFRNMATVWESSDDTRKVLFAEMDRTMWQDYVRDKFNIVHDATSKIIIYDTNVSRRRTPFLVCD